MHSFLKDGVSVVAMLDTRKPNNKGDYPIKVRVNHKRIREYYSIGISMSKSCWDKLPASKTSQSRDIKATIESSFSLVQYNVNALLEKGEFSFDTLNSRLGRATGDTLNNAFRAKIELLESEGRIGNMNIHVQTLKLVEVFKGNNIPLNSITVKWLKDCEQFWLQTKNQTSVGMHFRNIRAIMNQARKANVIKDSQYPFGKDKFEIKTGESKKKALPISQIKAIFEYTDGNLTTEKYRDLWVFIYLCNGINVADLVKLKFSNIIDDEICFVRQKTERTTKNRKVISAALTTEIQKIIDRWGNKRVSSNFIFPYLDGNETPIEQNKTTKELTKRINKRMKLIGSALGIEGITTYTARHSFATVLKRSGANIAYISESLGHSDIKTTESYLASFEKGDRIKNAHLLTNF